MTPMKLLQKESIRVKYVNLCLVHTFSLVEEGIYEGQNGFNGVSGSATDIPLFEVNKV